MVIPSSLKELDSWGMSYRVSVIVKFSFATAKCNWNQAFNFDVKILFINSITVAQ